VGTGAKAAALCLAIVRGHPSSDGNKRVALVALDAALALNDARLTATNDQAYTLIMALSRGELGREQLAAWVEEHLES
jgi:death-on-curing protein